MVKHTYPLKPDKVELHYFTPDICECEHGSINHKNILFIRTECNICECPKYKQDTDMDGYYVQCTKEESEITQSFMLREFYFRRARPEELKQ